MVPALAKVIYVSGSGRSGSTMLERILHSAPGVCALGELHCLWRLDRAAITCSCGSPFAAGRHWQRVLGAAGFGEHTLAGPRALGGRVCRSGYIARRGFSLDALRADPAVRRFLDLQFRLFEAVSDMSGASVLVDSSKAGPRAWLLACDERVAVAHLHRDPGDVIASWRSVKFDPGLGRPMQRMPIGAAALDWLKADRLAAALARRRPVARIDYHRLCADPRGEIAALYAALGLSGLSEPQWINGATVREGAGYHSLNGNPDRFARGPLRIAARAADWSGLPTGERNLIRGVAALVRAGAGRA